MTTTSLLSDGVVSLRALEPTDIDMVLSWENDPETWTVSNTQAPYSRQMIWQFLNTYTGDIFASRQMRLIITLSAQPGTAIGTIDFTDFDPLNSRAEIGMLIDRSFRGKGYGHRAVRLIKQFASQHIGIRQLYVLIPADNANCLHLFLNEGFFEAGLLRNWIKRGSDFKDVSLLQCMLP